MIVGINDADAEQAAHRSKGKFPNYALMKISAYHKKHGDSVEWFNPLNCYDTVYSSKVFTFSRSKYEDYLPENTLRGGRDTGFLKTRKLTETIRSPRSMS